MMNGFFDGEFTIPALMLRRLGRVPQRPAILSTRGEFAGGALGLKNGRKRAYRALARGVRLHHDVWLHATSPIEAEDILKVYPYARQVLIAPNIRQLSRLPIAREIATSSGPLRLAFLGRITRVKNVDYALDVLSKVRSPIAFDIYGPVQDVDYWKECRRISARLPANITVTHKGEIANDAVPAMLAGYDLFFLPTMGENFGHAIVDALAAGVPVVISDKTPFQDLEQHGAGWSFPLGERKRFVETIETVATMGSQERSQLRTAARRFAERMIEKCDAVAMNREMLRTVLSVDAI
jgi:glycosyltransferase involved in cell wall biosynthesis